MTYDACKDLDKHHFLSIASRVIGMSFTLLLFLLLSGQPALAIGKLINVKLAPYNAVGDGVTDDSAAIEFALSVASRSPGSVIFFPTGTYYHSSNLNVIGTTLRGAGKVSSVLRGGNVTLTADRSGLTGLGFDAGSTINDNSTKSAISNCAFRSPVRIENTSNVQVTGCDFSSTTNRSRLIAVLGCDRVALNQCTFTMSESFGVRVESCSNITLSSLRFSTNNCYGIEVYNVDKMLVENSVMQDSGVQALIVTNFGKDVTIRGNTLTFTSSSKGAFGLLSYGDENILVTNNKVKNAEVGISPYQSICQVMGNSVSDCQYGIYSSQSYSTIIGNQVSKIAAEGITTVDHIQTINGNILRDCGTASATAAIYVSGSPNVVIKNNIYTGNRENIEYFIRCLPPAPPAVVQGNITTTMLPTRTGP